MKTFKLNFINILVLLLIATLKSQAQVTVPANTGGSGDFVGWQISQNLNLDIVNEDPSPINFYTDGGSGSGGMWNNLRMFIQGANGNVGVGNFITANTMLHIHQSIDDLSSDLQMTTNGTGNTTSDGLLIDINPGGTIRFNQQELSPMQFWGMDATLSNTNVIRGEWTSGGAMMPNFATQPPTDGFRIWNPGYAATGGAYNPNDAIDIWTGTSGTTHMRYDNSGLLQGINLQFEQYARLNGFWLNAAPLANQTAFRGHFYFNLDSIEVSRFSNVDNAHRGFMRIGLQPAGLLG